MRHFQNDLVLGATTWLRYQSAGGARGGVAAQGQDVLQGILFEGLVQKEADDYQVIVGLIAGKAAKGQFFVTKVFQTAMRQFVGATLVMLKDQGGIVQLVFLVAALIAYTTGSLAARLVRMMLSGRANSSTAAGLRRRDGCTGLGRYWLFVALIGEWGITPHLLLVFVFFPFFRGNGCHLLLMAARALPVAMKLMRSSSHKVKFFSSKNAASTRRTMVTLAS